jgi:hypothetical protein
MSWPKRCKALALSGLARLSLELVALVVQVYLLQHAHVTELGQALAQQPVLQLARPALGVVEVGLPQGAASMLNLYTRQLGRRAPIWKKSAVSPLCSSSSRVAEKK